MFNSIIFRISMAQKKKNQQRISKQQNRREEKKKFERQQINCYFEIKL